MGGSWKILTCHWNSNFPGNGSSTKVWNALEHESKHINLLFCTLAAHLEDRKYFYQAKWRNKWWGIPMKWILPIQVIPQYCRTWGVWHAIWYHTEHIHMLSPWLVKQQFQYVLRQHQPTICSINCLKILTLTRAEQITAIHERWCRKVLPQDI